MERWMLTARITCIYLCIYIKAFIYMTTKVQKWGNSLAVRLPKELADRFSLYQGSSVVISDDNKSIKIKPTKERELTLKEMVRKINKHNRHELIDFGPPVGKEIF